MEQQPHRACKRTKSKQKQNSVTSHSNWPRVLLFNLGHRRCNGIMKGWLYWVKRKVSCQYYINVWLSYSANPIFFNNKKKNWKSKTLANPPPPNIWFSLYPPPLPKVDIIYVSPQIIYVWQKLLLKQKFYDKLGVFCGTLK